jgi:hypothetical protein
LAASGAGEVGGEDEGIERSGRPCGRGELKLKDEQYEGGGGVGGGVGSG